MSEMTDESTHSRNPGLNFIFRHILTVGIPLVFLITLIQASDADTLDKRALKIKAAYIYNLINFVEWQEEPVSRKTTITIFILGEDPFGDLFEPVKNRIIKNKILSVKHISNPNGVPPGNILYISPSEKNRLESILTSLGTRNILTISDMNDFTVKGGMIGFYEKDESIKLSINIKNTKHSGLRISSKLLELARIINK